MATIHRHTFCRFARSSLLICSVVGLVSGGCGETDAPARTRKALVVGWDGVRADAVQAAATPRLDALAGAGAYSFRVSTQTDTLAVSAPGWASILTGVGPDKHNITFNGLFGNHDHEYPSFLARGRALGKRTAAACVWAPLCEDFLGAEEALDLDASGSETAVTDQMATWLRDGVADLHFVHLDAPDHAGHLSGFAPDNTDYITAIENCDAWTGVLVDAIGARPTRATEEWLIVVTTDHGGVGKNHGEFTPENQTVFLVIAGDGVISGVIDATDVTHMDVHPTVMQFLGVASDPAWSLDSRPRGLSAVAAR